MNITVMRFKLIFLFCFLIALQGINAQEESVDSLSEDEMIKLLYADETGTQLEPDQVFELLDRFSKTSLGQSVKYRTTVKELIYLNDPEFCENRSLYNSDLSYMVSGLSDFPNLYRYVYSKSVERLEDGCLEGSAKPYFMVRYEQLIESKRTKAIQLQKYHDLSSKLNGTNVLSPLEILDLISQLKKIESNPKKRSFLVRLLNLADDIGDNNACTRPETVLTGYITRSFLSLPNIQKYVTHFQHLKREDCSWLEQSPAQRQAEAVDVEADCKLLKESIKLGFKATFLNSKAIVAEPPSTCDEDSKILARNVVNLASCEAKGCCRFVEKERNVEDAMRLVPIYHDLERYTTRMRKEARKACGATIYQDSLSTITKLADPMRSTGKRPDKKLLEDYVKGKVSSMKEDSSMSNTAKKLQYLDLLLSSCSEILSQVPPTLTEEYRGIYLNDLKLEERTLPETVRWCFNNQANLQEVRKDVARKKMGGLLSCIPGRC